MGVEDYEIIDWFNEISDNATSVQQETLRQILEDNYGVEYLSKWLGGVTNIREMDASTLEKMFTKLVPLSSHVDIEPYIYKIADGDTSPLLTQHPITHLSLSSGTTEGRQKYVPFTQHSAHTTLQTFRLAAAFRSRVYPTKAGGRILEFIYGSKQFLTKGGLTAGTATTHYFNSKEFKLKQEKTKCYTCSPLEVISSGDYAQTTYCHLLLGLFFSSKIEFITSTFVFSIVQALQTLEELWNELCRDIREGKLSSRITISSVRESVLQCFYPNPCLALTIRALCEELEKESWSGLIPKLWPNAKYVYSIMTGSMQPYLKKLRHYAGNLPLISADYGSTESWIGVNIDPSSPPENVTYAVVPTFSYFEFIPLQRNRRYEDGKSSAFDDFIEDEPVPLSKVKVGQDYEIVLTTFTVMQLEKFALRLRVDDLVYNNMMHGRVPNGMLHGRVMYMAVYLVLHQLCGLYRYRLGDVVQVSGFQKGTPKLSFICRRKLILTVNIDKNTEKDLQIVVETGSQILSQQAELVDFTSHANVASTPGHYVIFWEIKGEAEERVLHECCKKMDESFVDHGYVVSRKTNSIGPLELCIVERGTFKKILEYYIGNGAALSQFKTPRCTSNQKLLKILNNCTVKRFFSTAYDSISPN